MRNMIRYSAAALLMGACTLPAAADWRDFAKDVLSEGVQQQAASNPQVVDGLKEALAQGTTKAIKQLGQTDGFWGNSLVKIAAPKQLQAVSKGLRSAGQDALVDSFEQTMNRAAEQAVPEVADIFGDAIRKMSIADAQGILEGGDQAATNFFKRTTSQALSQRIQPLISKATDQAGVTNAYKQLMGQAGFLAQFVNLDGDSLDQHITQKALDGLFTMIGQEETRIRKDPAARSTNILKEVFGNR